MPKMQSQARQEKVVKKTGLDDGLDGSTGTASARIATPPSVLQFGQMGPLWSSTFSFIGTSPIWQSALYYAALPANSSAIVQT
jgi:hypothetical protein